MRIGTVSPRRAAENQTLASRSRLTVPIIIVLAAIRELQSPGTSGITPSSVSTVTA